MSEFDDPQLERLLGGAGGAFPDVNTALAKVQGRVRYIKRRRAMVASTAACVLLAAGSVFAMGRSDDRANLQPADGGIGVDTSGPETESTPVTDSSLPDTTVEQSGSNTTTPSSNSGSNSGSNGSGPSTSTSTATSTPVSVPADQPEQTYSTPGGSITVKVTSGALVLVSSQAADGFTLFSSTVDATRIEFRWRSDTDDQRVRIDLIGGLPVRKV